MADSILTWNSVALQADRTSHTQLEGDQLGPVLSSRALAIVHLAMYDAYAGVKGNPADLPAYLPGLPPAPPGASPQAAVAAAAHATLSYLYPSQKAYFDAALALYGDPIDPGHGVGLQVADAIISERAGDPKLDMDDTYVPSAGRFRHRPDPANPRQGFHAPFYGAQSKGFAVTARHELDAPPRGVEYLRALRTVRAKGIMPELMATLPSSLAGMKRTPEETTIGVFWAYDGAVGLGAPPRLFNLIVRRVAVARNNSEDENARLFALVNAAMADAGILAWDQKYLHDLWRPVVGIREHDRAFGPAAPDSDDQISADADPFWLPLGAPKTNVLNPNFPFAPSEPPTNRSLAVPVAELDLELELRDAPTEECAACLRSNRNFTPNFPSYPSGHATFGAAALHITRLFYGVSPGDRTNDDLFSGLDFVSDELFGGNAKLECGTEDNLGTVRPTHRRAFDGGLWQMIIENGLSRVFLGVHWVYDAFRLNSQGEPNVARNIGGVPLGLRIAEDIFNGGRANGLKKSPVGPRQP
jgi:membrane-associated phospholipid phosphatase